MRADLIKQIERCGSHTLDVADKLLQEKIDDPIPEVAGAYFLLRNNKLDPRKDWVQSLKNWFASIADGAIISVALAARRKDATEVMIRKDIEKALQRRMPVFATGANVLLQTMAVVHRGKEEKKIS